VLAAFDARRVYERDGYLSATAWLKHRCRLPGGPASDLVRLARALSDMPATSAAFRDGDIDFAAVRLLADAHGAHPEVFADHEATLVETARTLPAKELRTAVAYWRQALDESSSLSDANHAFDGRRLHISPTFGGMVRLDGVLDPLGGEVVMTALAAIMDSEARSGADEHRTPGQRRADGLAEVCRHWLDRGESSTVGGERPHLAVTVDLEVLERRAPGRAETASGQVLHPETVRRLACDAAVSRIITRGGSEPLDVGRRTRTIPPAIRRAVVIRDRHCAFPGCDRPPQWCDVHHIRHWARGGETCVANLALLCRRHHRLVHEGRWELTMGVDGLVFTTPDGMAPTRDRQARDP
jgi:hypothetical protein